MVDLPQILERRLAQSSAALTDWRRRLDEANTLLVNARTGPERAQSEISTSQARMATIEIALGSGREPGRARGKGSGKRSHATRTWRSPC